MNEAIEQGWIVLQRQHCVGGAEYVKNHSGVFTTTKQAEDYIQDLIVCGINAHDFMVAKPVQMKLELKTVSADIVAHKVISEMYETGKVKTSIEIPLQIKVEVRNE